MDRTAAIAELPEAYATALRLRDDRLSNKEIAARLGIEIEAVDPFLRIAVAKLDAVLATHQRPSAGGIVSHVCRSLGHWLSGPLDRIRHVKAYQREKSTS